MIQIITDSEELQRIIDAAIEKAFLKFNGKRFEDTPPIIPLKRAAEIAGKTPNALRVQISLGNLKCLHRGSRVYIDTEYFNRWLRGETEIENSKLEPTDILKKDRLIWETKKCPKCKEEKYFSDFYEDAKLKHGVSHYCKSCWTKVREESDSYHMRLIKEQSGYTLDNEDIPEKLIELKKETLNLKRNIKQQQNGNN